MPRMLFMFRLCPFDRLLKSILFACLVTAFNEYSSNMAVADAAKKPPSPSPRRKGGPASPPTPRRAHQHNQTKVYEIYTYLKKISFSSLCPFLLHIISSTPV